MSYVKEILEKKGSDVIKILEDASVFSALELLAEHDVGAIVVVNDKNKIVGIFSEREYARKLVLRGKSSKDTVVKEMMKDKLFFITPENNIWECMDLMSRKHIRYLPVVEGEELVGILSIGDIVQSIITQQKSKIDNLENYIMGSGYGTEIKMPMS